MLTVESIPIIAGMHNVFTFTNHKEGLRKHSNSTVHIGNAMLTPGLPGPKISCSCRVQGRNYISLKAESFQLPLFYGSKNLNVKI
jgi:hypothetical protein